MEKKKDLWQLLNKLKSKVDFHIADIEQKYDREPKKGRNLLYKFHAMGNKECHKTSISVNKEAKFPCFVPIENYDIY